MAKRIIASISLALIAIVIVATIVMASVKVDYGISCNNPDFVRVKYQDKTASRIEDKELVKKIEDIVSNGSKSTLLTSLFNGGLNKKPEIEDVTSSYANIGNPANFMVGYFYTQPQILKDGKKDYLDANGNKYYYRGLWFVVNDLEGEQEVEVYIVPWYMNETPNNNIYTHQKKYKLSVNLDGLYDLLKDANLDKYAN